MKRFRTYLDEAIDRPYSWKQTSGFKGPMTRAALDKGGASYLQVFDFRDKTGEKISVEFNWARNRLGDDSLHVNVDFGMWESKNSLYDLSGHGDAFRVMATVVDIMKTLAKSEADVITFSAEKYEDDLGERGERPTGRIRAYKALVRRFASKIGFSYSVKEDGSYAAFRLVRK